MERKWWIRLGVLIFVAISAFVYLKTNTYTEHGRVSELTWQRDIQVEKYKQFEETAVQGYQPADAYDLVPYTYHWTTYSTTRCGKNCSITVPISHTEKRFRYHINRWAYDYTLRAVGTYRDERAWPDFTPSADIVLGALRESGRNETFFVAFRTEDGKSFMYSTNKIDDWRSCSIESSWTFQVNRLEEPQWNTLKED